MYAIEKSGQVKNARKKTGIQAQARQKLAAKIRTENPEISDKKVLQMAGYKHGNSTEVMNSKGYKLALAEYGLTEALITSALVEDIKQKPQRRVQELTLGADILGMRKREEPQHNTVNIALFSTEQQEKIAQRILNTLNKGESNV